jgi:hypothetical protein
MTSRRTFLKAGVGASALLALGGGIYRATRKHPAPHAFALDAAARTILGAIAPALLAGSWQAGHANPVALGTVIDDVGHAILKLPLSSQAELRDLFGLLDLAPARRVLTGIAGPWSGASPAAVHGFLQDWRTSPFGLLRAAYAALHDLVLGAWYAAPASWQAIGYPGPQLEWGP